jgi:hypothetical protein
MAELFDGRDQRRSENLRLLKAFLRIKDPTVRRAIVELVERKSTLLTSEKKVPAPREG